MGPKRVPLGRLHEMTNRYSSDEVDITELYAIALDYRKRFREQRDMVGKNEEICSKRVVKKTKQLEQKIVFLHDEVNFLTQRIDKLKNLTVKHCDKGR